MSELFTKNVENRKQQDGERQQNYAICFLADARVYARSLIVQFMKLFLKRN